MGRVVAGRGEGVAGGSGGAGCVVGRPGVAAADRGALAAGVAGDGPVGVDGGAADDRDGDLRAVDGAQAALPVGVSDAGGGGVGLDSSAPVLPDRLGRAGAGRVDGPQAHQAGRGRDGVADDARVDRQGDAGEAVSPAGGADRLDRDRGGREVPDRRGAGVERSQGVGAGGPQAREADRGEEGAGAGSLAGDGSAAQNDHSHDPAALRGGQAGGPEVDWRDRGSCSSARSRKRAGWRRSRVGGRVGGVPRRS